MIARQLLRAALLAPLALLFVCLYAGVVLLDWASRSDEPNRPAEKEQHP